MELQLVSDEESYDDISLIWCHLIIILIGGLDFNGIVNRELVFSPTVDRETVTVVINDDDFLEHTLETFTANLASTVPRLSLGPVGATVNIADNDSECHSVTH